MKFSGFKNMESELGFLVSVLIICADITAGVLGIQAEMAQNKQHHHLHHPIHSPKHHGCGRTPSAGAFAEGVAALVILGIVHITANVLGGCSYIRSSQDFTKTANKILAVTFLLLSWILFAGSYTTMMLATLANSSSSRICSLPHRWLFLTGGILCIGHGLATSVYYVSAVAAKKEDKEIVQQANPATTSRV